MVRKRCRRRPWPRAARVRSRGGVGKREDASGGMKHEKACPKATRALWLRLAAASRSQVGVPSAPRYLSGLYTTTRRNGCLLPPRWNSSRLIQSMSTNDSRSPLSSPFQGS